MKTTRLLNEEDIAEMVRKLELARGHKVVGTVTVKVSMGSVGHEYEVEALPVSQR